MGKNLSAVRAPKSINADRSGGGSMSEEIDPEATVTGKATEGQGAVTSSRKSGDPAQPGTNMQGAGGNPTASRAGAQNVSSATAKIAQVKTGNTDF